MSDAPRDLANRIIQAFDTPQAAAAATEAVVDPVSGDIVARPIEGQQEPVHKDGGLDMEELDLSMVAFSSDLHVDAVSFMRWADADHDQRLDLDELETMLAVMDDLHRRSLAVKLTRLESAREAFAAARPSSGVGKWLAKAGFRRDLLALDEAFHAARVDFVGHLMAYAGARRGA